MITESMPVVSLQYCLVPGFAGLTSFYPADSCRKPAGECAHV